MVELRASIPPHFSPEALALTGQMHGAVLVQADGRPVRPAILWADRRAAAETGQLIARWGPQVVAARTGLPPHPNYVFPKLLWLARHEPAALARAERVLLPKDWLRLQLAGGALTEPTDASGTGLWDGATGRWAADWLAPWGISAGLLPEVVPSAAVVGGLRPGWAQRLGLPAGLPVVAGAGDLPAAVLASGVQVPGLPICNVGSAAQVAQLLPARSPLNPGVLRFLHPDPRWQIDLVALLAAGTALAWARQRLAGAGLPPAAQVPRVLFLPQLAGERSLEGAWDGSAEAYGGGAWLGLSLETSPEEMVSAAAYGVAMAIREALERLAARAPHAWASARTAPVVLAESMSAADWAARLANVLGQTVQLISGSPSALGAALLAGVGVGALDWDGCVPPSGTTCPVPCLPEAASRLQGLYAAYRRLRQALGEVLGFPLHPAP